MKFNLYIIKNKLFNFDVVDGIYAKCIINFQINYYI